ncbi:MAG TPA: acetamidase/formamidase family protein [Thermoplasmata archaeon]|jgi:amidase
MRKLGANRAIYYFSPKNKPAYSVSDGERVIVETKDCFSGLAKSSRDIFEDIAMGDVNPATGPIKVDGIVSGDVLKVSIEKIKLGNKGVIMCSPELGILAKEVRKSRTKIVPIESGRARLSKDIVIELNPHVGVVGVSPSEGKYPTFHPGDFGGNLDTVEVCEGSNVYLPAFVDGGMVALGDVHAAMGDGEVCGTGVETSGEITITLSKAHEIQLKRPMIETRTEWIAYAAARTLDDAARLATHDLVTFVANRLGTDFEEAYMLASVAANLRISQVVDPLMAARMSISKKYL